MNKAKDSFALCCTVYAHPVRYQPLVTITILFRLWLSRGVKCLPLVQLLHCTGSCCPPLHTPRAIRLKTQCLTGLPVVLGGL